MNDIRTLCYQCRQDYIDAGYTVKTWHQDIMHECDKCGRLGFEVQITPQIESKGERKNDIKVF